MNVDAIAAIGSPLGCSAAAPIPEDARQQRNDLVQAVRAVNATETFGQNAELTFALDRQTRRALIRLVDRRTGELIRQIPPEDVLAAAEALRSRR